MFDYFSAKVIGAYIPDITYSVPVFGQVDLRPFIFSVSVFVILNILFWLLRHIVVNRLTALSTRTDTDVDDVIVQAVKGIRAWVYSIVSVYAALQVFTFSERADLILTAVFLFAVVWQAISIASCFVGYSVARLLSKDEDGDGLVDPNAATATDMVTLIVRIGLWVVGGLFVLSNLGIEVTSLIAGLGIGGIAIAFALQGILSDLFASFSIYFDRPFRIGDFIVIGPDSGTVEKIGIKTTRIRTLQGEELVVSNAELTAARVQNFKKMQERRIVSQFGILYETPQKLVTEVPSMVTRIFDDIETARLDRVHFVSFGDSALIYEVVYYVESADYTEYLDAQQKFNLALLSRFAEANIEFAYPTQVVYTKSVS